MRNIHPATLLDVFVLHNKGDLDTSAAADCEEAIRSMRNIQPPTLFVGTYGEPSAITMALLQISMKPFGSIPICQRLYDARIHLE